MRVTRPSSPKAVGKGTGQGLSIAHTEITKKHGGTLTFVTELGKGTTFIIRLPLTSTVRHRQLGTPQKKLLVGDQILPCLETPLKANPDEHQDIRPGLA